VETQDKPKLTYVRPFIKNTAGEELGEHFVK
jgi:hypothetical protein